jgi:hypothetical protein
MTNRAAGRFGFAGPSPPPQPNMSSEDDPNGIGFTYR